MAKIIITEKQYNLIKESIDESIDPSEAYRDEDSVQTVIDGRRNVAFIPIRGNNKIFQLAINAGLNMFKIQRERDAVLIMYNDGYENQAKELAQIANKYNGYLPCTPDKISADEVYRIGRLLDYNRQPVIDFVTDKFNLRPNYFNNTDIYK